MYILIYNHKIWGQIVLPIKQEQPTWSFYYFFFVVVVIFNHILNINHSFYQKKSQLDFFPQVVSPIIFRFFL